MFARSIYRFRRCATVLAPAGLALTIAGALLLSGCNGGESAAVTIVETNASDAAEGGAGVGAEASLGVHPGAPTERTGQDPIKLGMLVPLTGTEAAFGEAMRNGAQLAVDELNGAGGVNGREVELVVEDEACDAITAFEAAPRMVAAGIEASVGGFCAGAILPTLPIFGEARIPFVVPAGASRALVGQGAFLMSGTPVHEAAAWLNAARHYRPAGTLSAPSSSATATVGRTTPVAVAVLADRTVSAKELATLFLQQIEQAELAQLSGIPTVVYSGSVALEMASLEDEVESVLDTQPDFVVWAGHPEVGVPLVGALRAADFRGPILVPGSADRVGPLPSTEAPGATLSQASAHHVAGTSLEAYAAAGVSELVFASTPLTPELLSDEDEWISAYTRAFGIAPGRYSLEAYDAVRVVAEAMRVAGSTRGDLVTTALQSLERYPVFSGRADFNDEGLLRGTGNVRMVASTGDGISVTLTTDLRRWSDSRANS